MSKRYYLAPMVQRIGQGGNPTWRAKVMDYPTTAVSTLISPDPSAPDAWALCVVEASSHSPILADPDIVALPDLSMDSSIQSLAASGRQALEDMLDRFNLRSRMSYRNNDPFRVVLQQIGRMNMASFNENDFDAHVS